MLKYYRMEGFYSRMDIGRSEPQKKDEHDKRGFEKNMFKDFFFFGYGEITKKKGFCFSNWLLYGEGSANLVKTGTSLFYEVPKNGNKNWFKVQYVLWIHIEYVNGFT